MGTRSIVLRALRSLTANHSKAMPLRILEIGAGDGSLMLGVAQAMVPMRLNVLLTLFDRQPLVEPSTIERYKEVGWNTTQQVGDVIDLAASGFGRAAASVNAPWHLVVSNLFLHHFEGAQLDLILKYISRHSQAFFACEPRRDWLSLAGSHMIGAIGANHVTRQDAVLSVHAGFNGNELTDRWPNDSNPWILQEYSAGLFSHCFRAESARLH
ncbi:class I SAM-dependent methyltransferase [Curvibacter sp. APW13]|uniref:class I SAM-dependent methyltransferase n=1 Tax=Curvibacter sp. APW13 TaxID=3077236 RepID=UPI0028E028F8|nr:class I SAM-dependent methyltransferase [Curvibacter sp. APW13]MDT8992624.1 class I SAM-dependent methyltransferase [Curvibacter sp. APW13]